MADETATELIAKALIAGNVCAFVSAFVNPLDVTKIRLQNQQSLSSSLKYRGMLSGVLTILREEGLTGWGKGLTASMMREVTYSSVRIGAYEPIRSFFGGEAAAFSHQRCESNDSNSRGGGSSTSASTTTTPAVKFASALVSGGVGAAMASPLDLIKTRFQAHLPHEPLPYATTYRAFVDIYRYEGGLSGLYKGWPVTSTRAAILTSAQLGSYDSIKNNLCVGILGMHEGFQLHLVAAMASGLITTTAANPIDVIKTRYMSDATNRYPSPLACAMHTYREGGIRAFFKGWTPAYWRLGPHTVFSFLLIERIRSFVGLRPI